MRDYRIVVRSTTALSSAQDLTSVNWRVQNFKNLQHAGSQTSSPLTPLTLSETFSKSWSHEIKRTTWRDVLGFLRSLSPSARLYILLSSSVAAIADETEL